MKGDFTFQQIIVIAFTAVVAIVFGAIISGYTGSIQFNFGTEGINLEIEGGE